MLNRARADCSRRTLRAQASQDDRRFGNLCQAKGGPVAISVELIISLEQMPPTTSGRYFVTAPLMRWREVRLRR